MRSKNEKIQKVATMRLVGDQESKQFNLDLEKFGTFNSKLAEILIFSLSKVELFK